MQVALVVAQYVMGALAVAALVAGEVLGWNLSAGVAGLLGGFVGLALKRPSDLAKGAE